MTRRYSSRDVLSAAQRRRIPSNRFALPRTRKLPLNDASHVRNAATRLEQMRNRGSVTASEYRSAHRRIRAAERRLGITPTSSRDYGTRYRAATHVYATPEVKRTASYKRAERLEQQLAPSLWNTPGLSRSNLERVADAWERAGFLGWADNYRASVRGRPERDARRRLAGRAYRGGR